MSQQKAPLIRFPLKSCFKMIFQDCSADFQMCMWFDYLYNCCGQHPHALIQGYPQNMDQLADTDSWLAKSSKSVLDAGVDGLVAHCIHPGKDAPGVHDWVQARYHPKTVFRMIDAMLKLLYSICSTKKFGPTPLRHGLDRRDGNFYLNNPVFLGKKTSKYPNIPKEHKMWLGQIDACLRPLLGDEKFTSRNLDDVLEGFNQVKAKYGAKQGEQKNIVLSLVNPSKGPRGRGGLFDVLSCKLRTYFNFFKSGDEKVQASSDCQTILKANDDKFGPIDFLPSALAMDAEAYRAFFTPRETISWANTKADRTGNRMQQIHDLGRRRLIGNLIRLAGHPKDFGDFMDKIFTGMTNFNTFKDQDALQYFQSFATINLEKHNSDVIKEAIEQETSRAPPTPKKQLSGKRSAEEVEYDLPSHLPPSSPIDRKKRRFTEPPKNNSAIWIIGGGIVLVMAFIRS